MKISNIKSRIVEFVYNELFSRKQGPFDAPNYTLNTFFPFKENRNYFVLRWSLDYIDKQTHDLLFSIVVQTEFAFEVENQDKDYLDVMKRLNIFYDQITDFVRDNTEGHFDKLIPKPFVFDDVIARIKAHGYYQYLN